MILHLLIVDDEEEVLESLIPGFVADLARKLAADKQVQKASELAGRPLPASGRINIKVTAHGYDSLRAQTYRHARPVHLHLHLCCEKGGGFRHALRLLKEQLFAVVVYDLRFADDAQGARAGRLFIDDVQRRNRETFCVLYSAYQKPDGFPPERFVRKGSATNMGGDELCDKIREGVAFFLSMPPVRRFASELARRGLVYQSDLFGATLKRLYDIAGLYFGAEAPAEDTRRRPRPTLLLDGETGTGKTELAGLMHQASERAAEPFVSASCGQLSDENLVRSSLFGHIRGSFSGATADRAGLVQAAGKGILLLDDLHKLSDGGSVILHSFLDDGEYAHVGQDEQRRIAQAGIVVTVETPKWEQVKSTGVLSDSFVNRVEQLVVRVPTLRDRPEDIEHQAQYYAELHGKKTGAVDRMELAPAAIAWLVDFGFPGGNSRRLRDFLKGLIAANARVTDYLGVTEVEEFAAESGLLTGGRPVAIRSTAPNDPAASSAVAPNSANSKVVPATAITGHAPQEPLTADDHVDDNWIDHLEAGSWPARAAELAIAAVEQELSLDRSQACGVTGRLFAGPLPDLWDRLQKLMVATAPRDPLDIKLVDELVRCFAIFKQGSPAKAAKELRMKDNALREFIYSREEKRQVRP